MMAAFLAFFIQASPSPTQKSAAYFLAKQENSPRQSAYFPKATAFGK
jgi:hypothetical protein